MKAKFVAYEEPLIFEISGEGKCGFMLPEPDVPEEEIPETIKREDIEDFPEVSETEIVRHFTRLSQLNYCVDKGFYPLGSCTMKYNPKINEKISSLEGFTDIHPLFPEKFVQGCLEIIYTLERYLSEITGMDRFTLAPLAGAHGELTGMLIIRGYHMSKGEGRKKVLIPDSAHGTNPSSAHLSGWIVEEIPSNSYGTVDIEKLKERVDESVAALMLTNPNTIGIFEKDIKVIGDILHSKGSLLYMDGANLNALIGIADIGKMGVDVLHTNLHKTFSTPHGGGGPGSGPVGVKEFLEPFLPVPRVEKRNGEYILNWDKPQSIGKICGFYGNFLVLVKALAYILSLGYKGLREVAKRAVLNANYIRKKIEGIYNVPYNSPSLHEFVCSDKGFEDFNITTLDVAKRLIDYGLHPPTIYFPLIVKGALMIEPTETESKRDLDLFISAMIEIINEAKENPEVLKNAPHLTTVGRLDEVLAAKKLVLRWKSK
ncbi:MAG: aminomethyl-transferring glycine dehydrogenase subunit GcvPB [Candidatus Aminicenantia bacterium]